MRRGFSNDLDYLATRLHVRRSRMAEGVRLQELCRLASMADLSRAVFATGDFAGVAEFQRALVRNLVRELSDTLQNLEEEGADLVVWLIERFQVENIKLLLRGYLNRVPWEKLQPHLAALPHNRALPAPALLAAKSLEEFAALLPPGSPAVRLQSFLRNQPEMSSPFLLEAALDCGYFHELLARTNRLPSGEAEVVKPLSNHETNQFKFLLVVRGKFLFGLPAEPLSRLPLPDRSADARWLSAVLSCPDVVSAARLAPDMVVDALPPGFDVQEPSSLICALENLAWRRYLRLANSAFRRSHMDIGAVVGYFGIRRIEVMNLIAVSEGVRARLDGPACWARLLRPADMEVAHV